MSVADNISTRTIADTVSLEDEVQKKLLKQVEKGKIQANDVRDVTRRLKQFSEPEQQLEEIDRIIDRSETARGYEEIGYEKDLEISTGEIPPEIIIGKEKYVLSGMKMILMQKLLLLLRTGNVPQ